MKTVFFKSHMVSAILNGQKVQTRRPVKMEGKKLMPCFYKPNDILSVYEDNGKCGCIPTGLMLKIRSIDIQHVAGINEQDISKEGIFLSLNGDKTKVQYTYCDGEKFPSAKDAFIALWGSIHPPGSPNCWQNNPQVWVIEFAVTHVPKISHRLIR